MAPKLVDAQFGSVSWTRRLPDQMDIDAPGLE